MTTLYMASKTIHAEKWRKLRSNGFNIISTWIDEAGIGETKCFSDLWTRCVNEASKADLTIVYRERDEVLKGAFIEVGASLSSNKKVFTIGCQNFSFINHPNVTEFPTLAEAFYAVRP